MKRFILLSFLFLGFGFYELSGGTEFDPETARETAVNLRTERNVARAALSGFVSGTANRADPIQTTTSTTNDAVTRTELNLVSFEAVTSQPGTETQQPASAAPDPAIQSVTEPVTPLIELADTVANGPEQISMAALDDVEPAQAQRPSDNGNSFAGSSVVAYSLPLGTGSDIRSVSGTLVNMRSGPSTDFDVIDQLSQGTEVEILSDSGNGWVELRPVDGGVSGWIAEFLLTGG